MASPDWRRRVCSVVPLLCLWLCSLLVYSRHVPLVAVECGETVHDFDCVEIKPIRRRRCESPSVLHPPHAHHSINALLSLRTEWPCPQLDSRITHSFTGKKNERTTAAHTPMLQEALSHSLCHLSDIRSWIGAYSWVCWSKYDFVCVNDVQLITFISIIACFCQRRK